MPRQQDATRLILGTGKGTCAFTLVLESQEGYEITLLYIKIVYCEVVITHSLVEPHQVNVDVPFVVDIRRSSIYCRIVILWRNGVARCGASQ